MGQAMLYPPAMFTGLVRATGELREASARTAARHLFIAVALEPQQRAVGASVAVDGVCLTVTASDETGFAAQAAFETLDRTTIGSLLVGDQVNIEPALCLGDSLGGHLVSGHVDGVAVLRRVDARGDARECEFSLDSSLSRFVAAKGSICVSGVSLTVNHAGLDSFTVGLVPHTLAATTLGAMRVGARVNIEVDIIARYLDRLASHRLESSGGIDMNKLISAGFCSPGST